jgi:hypothetical protein
MLSTRIDAYRAALPLNTTAGNSVTLRHKPHSVSIASEPCPSANRASEPQRWLERSGLCILVPLSTAESRTWEHEAKSSLIVP